MTVEVGRSGSVSVAPQRHRRPDGTAVSETVRPSMAVERRRVVATVATLGWIPFHLVLMCLLSVWASHNGGCDGPSYDGCNPAKGYHALVWHGLGGIVFGGPWLIVGRLPRTDPMIFVGAAYVIDIVAFCCGAVASR